MVASRGPNNGWEDFNVEYPGYSGQNVMSVMTYIILCNQGYENANYVAGEIKEAKRTLKWADITSISLLSVFNVLVTMVFFAIADFETLTTPQGQAETAYLFAKIVFGTTKGMRVAVLIVRLGSLISITYTMSRVKQAIAWQRIIPFSRMFGRQDPYYDSPGGGLFLHWIVTVIAILALDGNSSESQDFFNGIYVYGYQFMFIFLALGLIYLAPRMRQYYPKWKPTYFKNFFVKFLVIGIFVSWNIVTLVMYVVPNNPRGVPRFYWAISFVALVCFALLYWAILRIFQVEYPVGKAISEKVGLKVDIYEDGDDDVPDELEFSMLEAHFDGTKRRLNYTTWGFLARIVSGSHKTKNAILRCLAY